MILKNSNHNMGWWLGASQCGQKMLKLSLLVLTRSLGYQHMSILASNDGWEQNNMWM
jgi:hypothetical protein